MKLFVWDFHGVLEVGNDAAVIELTNLALEERNFDVRLSKQKAEIFSGLKWHEYFQRLLPKEDESIHFELQKRCFEISHSRLDIIKKHIRLNDGAKEVLEKIQNKGHRQILISNTNQSVLKYYIEIVHVEKYFPDGSYFGVDAHMKNNQTKQDILKNYLTNNFFNSMVVIGDSPKDVELSNLLKNSVSYLYSYPNRAHREAIANYKITNLLEILKEI